MYVKGGVLFFLVVLLLCLCKVELNFGSFYELVKYGEIVLCFFYVRLVICVVLRLFGREWNVWEISYVFFYWMGN